MLSFEQESRDAGYLRVAGVDEAGRGPLAGPVCAAAVIISPAAIEDERLPFLGEVNDSKTVSAARREDLFQAMVDSEDVEIAAALVSPDRVDRINILNATREAMIAALARLDPSADRALIDGRPMKDLHRDPIFIVRGDSRSVSIAAASIVAKVTRDRIMDGLDVEYPQYGFSRNKGYGTREHLRAIERHGPCPYHRRSFRPISEMIAPRLDI